MRFAPDLASNIANGDANYLSVLDEADAFIARNDLDLPEEPEARKIGPDPDCVAHPILDLDLAKAGNRLHHLGDGLHRRLWLAQGRDLRREGKAEAPARRRGRARRVFPWPALAIAPGIDIHLGRVARRQIHRRPDRDPAWLSGLCSAHGWISDMGPWQIASESVYLNDRGRPESARVS